MYKGTQVGIKTETCELVSFATSTGIKCNKENQVIHGICLSDPQSSTNECGPLARTSLNCCELDIPA